MKVSQRLEDEVEGFGGTVRIGVDDQIIVLGIPKIVGFVHPLPFGEVPFFPFPEMLLGFFNRNIIAVDDAVNPEGIVAH